MRHSIWLNDSFQLFCDLLKNDIYKSQLIVEILYYSKVKSELMRVDICFCDLLSFDTVQSRSTYDLLRSYCPFRYEKIHSNVKFSIGFRSYPIIFTIKVKDQYDLTINLFKRWNICPIRW